jgi:hypothetical protein
VGGIQRYLRSQLGSLIPSSVATVTTALDPWDRELWSVFDGMLERTPWTQAGMPLKRDLWGFPKLLGWGFDDSWLTRMGSAATPLTLGKERVAPIDAELYANGIQLARPAKTFFPRESAMAKVDLDPTVYPRLSPEQYERYELLCAANGPELQRLGVEYPAEYLKQLTGAAGALVRAKPPQQAMMLVDVLDWLVTTQDYQAQSQGPQGGRERLIRQVVEAYREAGKALMLQMDDDLAARYQGAVVRQTLQRTPPAQRPQVQEQINRTLEGIGIGR